MAFKKVPPLSDFYKKTEKFINEYIEVWALQMEKRPVLE